ncbi:tRNA (adenosine(37)-N6)-threonylcarbamoyltransferase complex dimerization subunit type 1 TsaB [Candidatus Saccharibacteria bacterium]|nr:tRNA (adenosine(37)-N6)-threonylcarbamoyltransferase complex dimerization subunit type 1 TsaB [Candidatus Saccharibacteria bacterium]
MKILLLDTSTSTCHISLVDGTNVIIAQDWEVDRQLAKELLKRIADLLSLKGLDWTDIEAIGVFEGPGSFTGLRIGLTVANTIADGQSIPIVGSRGDDWADQALAKISSGQNEKIVLPFYGSEAKITSPKK